jgi:hypothetical protein
MKKLLRASILTVGLSISAFAAERIPVDTKGGVTIPEYAGISTCMITSATTTLPVLCVTGSGIVLDIVGSSVVATSYLTLRDSATANTSSTELLRVSDEDLAGMRIFPRFKNGLSVNASSTAGPGATGAWTVIYTSDLR